jgi:hypothetical protein
MMTDAVTRLLLWRTWSGDCAICFKSETDATLTRDGPLNSAYPTRCSHWLCEGCWQDLRDRGITRCPQCREDVSEWLFVKYDLNIHMEEGPARDFLQNNLPVGISMDELEGTIWTFSYMGRRITGRFAFLNNTELNLMGSNTDYELQHIRHPLVRMYDNHRYHVFSTFEETAPEANPDYDLAEPREHMVRLGMTTLAPNTLIDIQMGPHLDNLIIRNATYLGFAEAGIAYTLEGVVHERGFHTAFVWPGIASVTILN